MFFSIFKKKTNLIKKIVQIEIKYKSKNRYNDYRQ